MTLRSLIVTSCAVAALVGCATGAHQRHARFDPAACVTRDFSVYFEPHGADLDPAAREVIDTMAASLHGCRINHVRIVGSAGANAADERAQDRARVLGDYLTAHVGWPQDKLELLATTDRGATTGDGLAVPMRRRAQITVDAVAP